jgi:hypothetical protein
MARLCRELVPGMVLLGLSGIAPTAAQSVPKSSSPAQTGGGRSNAARPTAITQPQNPVADLASGLKSFFDLENQPSLMTPVTKQAALTPAQRAQVDKVSAYLSSVHQMVGHFIQVAPDGSHSQGEFYVQM